MQLPPGIAMMPNAKINLNGVAPTNAGGGNPFGRSLEQQGRHLTATSIGTRTVLAVWIKDTGRIAGEQQPGYTSTSLRNEVFGDLVDGGTSNVCLASQYSACSYNQLNFVPTSARTSNAPGIASDIVNGVVEVTVSTTCTNNACDGTIRNAVKTALNNAFGVSAQNLAQHVMMCLPPNSMGGIAYAYLPVSCCCAMCGKYSPGWVDLNCPCSVFFVQITGVGVRVQVRMVHLPIRPDARGATTQTIYCMFTRSFRFPLTNSSPLFIPQIGHNIGLHHSGEGTTEYADQSGMVSPIPGISF